MNSLNKSLVLASTTIAALASVGTATARADAAGMAVINKMAARYAGLKSYSDKWTTTVTATSPVKRTDIATGIVRIARPNRFFMTQERKGFRELVLTSDGKNDLVYSGLQRSYAKSPSASSFPKTLQSIDHGPIVWMSGRSPLEGIEDARVIGSETINGVPVDVIDVKVKPRFFLPKNLKPSDKQRKEIEAKIAEVKRNLPQVRYYVGKNDSLMYRNVFVMNQKMNDGKMLVATKIQEHRDVRPDAALTASDFTFTLPPGTRLAQVPPPNMAPKKK